MILWQIIFWLSLFLIVHSYILFPWMLQILATKKKENQVKYQEDELPAVTLLLSVYNEERVLEKKLDSILNSDYPSSKLTILIGSDASSDNTNDILLRYQANNIQIKAVIFEDRQGKPKVINHLVNMVEDEIMILTDAKVMFHPNTVKGLASHFKNKKIGIVGGNILNESVQKDGVSIQENAFMSREMLMKYHEGIIWGATIGVYGAIYAIRKNLYKPVPVGFSVDDFFISMYVLRQKSEVILDINVLSYEDVPNRISEEYRRKVRIATGNYKNLRFFAKELLTPWKGASFAFFSHKALRWLAPFIFIFFLLSNVFLYNYHLIYEYALYAALGIIALPIIDYFLSKIGIHIVFLRFVRHFVTMNIALLHGFINNLRGVKKDVWQPTNR